MQPVPELLAPAGNHEKLLTALAYGADAVYFGSGSLNLRAKAGGFSSSADVVNAVQTAHKAGRKAYFCLNLFALEKNLKAVIATLEMVAEINVDALIIADPGVFRLARKYAPDIPVHLSTQANTSNSQSALFWRDMGVNRVNLAREMNFSAIRSLCRELKGSLETEVFVHGAMCMSFSGRCLLSSYLCSRSANQGLCAHPCRFDYHIAKAWVEERSRPGKICWEMEEEEGFTRIMAANDLCLARYLRWFSKAGVKSVKIEGRIKGSSYVAICVDAYRTALDQIRETGRFNYQKIEAEVNKVSTRPLSSGFFLNKTKILAEPAPDDAPQILARVFRRQTEDRWVVQIKKPWDTNKPIRLVLPGLSRPNFSAANYTLEDDCGRKLSPAHPGTEASLRLQSPHLKKHLFIQQGNLPS